MRALLIRIAPYLTQGIRVWLAARRAAKIARRRFNANQLAHVQDAIDNGLIGDDV
jgi:hypothetical protein